MCRDGHGRVLLCRNHGGAWELPGGRPERAEPFPETVIRELREETGLTVTPGRLAGAEPLEASPGKWVAVLTYAAAPAPGEPRVSDEHAEVAYLDDAALEGIELPACYRRAIDAVPAPLFHIALRADWDAARTQGSYHVSTRGQTLAQVGFIHLSFAAQIAGTVDRFYADVPDLVVLRIDPRRLAHPVRVEPVPTGERFPHLYGPLDTAAVIDALTVEAACQISMML